MCKKKHRKRGNRSEPGSSERPSSFGTNETLFTSTESTIDDSKSLAYLKDDETTASLYGEGKKRKNKMARKDKVRSPKLRMRIQRKRLFRLGKCCPLSSCIGKDNECDNNEVPSDKSGGSSDIVKKNQKKKVKKARYGISFGMKRKKGKEEREIRKSNSRSELNPGICRYRPDNEANSSGESHNNTADSSLPRIELKEDANLSPKLLRMNSSDSMVWSEASWNRPTSPAFEKSSDKSSKRTSRDTGNTSTAEHVPEASSSGKERVSVPLLATDELRVIYTTPDRLDHLQRQVDQTREILAPSIVNRARGMIDWASDELNRSVKLCAATNQEFLTVGDNHGTRRRRLWMTTFFSKNSTRKARSGLPRLPSSQELTPALAAARESSFTLIAPSRNTRVRLTTDYPKSDTGIPITHGLGSKENADSIDPTSANQSNVDQPESNKVTKGGNKPKPKRWWKIGRNAKSQDVRRTAEKKIKLGESRNTPELQTGTKCRDSTKKRFSWKSFRSSTKFNLKTDPQSSPRDQIVDTKSTTETDNSVVAVKESTSSPTEDNDHDVPKKKGKVSRTWSSIRKGWKRFNDWLDE